jgi:hypothetical protein
LVEKLSVLGFPYHGFNPSHPVFLAYFHTIRGKVGNFTIEYGIRKFRVRIEWSESLVCADVGGN